MAIILWGKKTFFKRAQFQFFSFFGFFLKKVFSKKTKKVPKKSVFLKIFLFYFKNPEVFDRAQFFSFLFFFIFFYFFFIFKKKIFFAFLLKTSAIFGNVLATPPSSFLDFFFAFFFRFFSWKNFCFTMEKQEWNFENCGFTVGPNGNPTTTTFIIPLPTLLLEKG